KIATLERAESNKWFFKTGKGEYGEGDKFIGLTVPQTRTLVRVFNEISLSDTEKLLNSAIHEERLLALLLLVDKFEKAKNLKEREIIFNLYFKNIKYINNWDLVDTSAPRIVGAYIKEKYSLKTKSCSGVKFLNSLVSDKNKFTKNQKEKLWEKRIGIVSTLFLIVKSKKDEFASEVVLEVVKKNLTEKDNLNSHDLLQKASGWMLREYGKRISEKRLKEFLSQNFNLIKNKRTLLRYAIEKLPERERKEWLNKPI
ncbi:MAG: hypothetical protein RI945_323, partial [Candidatus Parcubacteria bacterium]